MLESEIKTPPQKVSAIARYAETVLPTKYGDFRCVVYRDIFDSEHVALIQGTLARENTLCRIHSECLTGEVFGSLRCDCRQQFEKGMSAISQNESGILLYLRQEGRGIGLGNKIRAYELQDEGLDTVEANRALGFADDGRDYAVAAAILFELGVSSVQLMTNNPSKIEGLEKHGVVVSRRIPHVVSGCQKSQRYLETKSFRMGHLL